MLDTIASVGNILKDIRETKIFEQSHKAFNTGKTYFLGHKKFLFLTKKYE